MATTTAQKKTTKKAAPKSVSLEAPVYSASGKKGASVKLPAAVFGAPWNADLVHGVVLAMQANARAGTAHTKDRSEVRGGGRKPWKQKGTGRARHGSRRSPIWTGGGVTFGPRSEKDYTQKVNKNVRAKALAAVLSKKYADGEVILVDALGMSAPKAKDAKTFVSAFEKEFDGMGKKKNAALIVLNSRDENAEKSFRNFGNLLVEQAKDVNPVELLTYKYVIVADPDKSLETLARRVALKSARTAKTA